MERPLSWRSSRLPAGIAVVGGPLPEAPAITRALLRWYDENRRRHLPWRERPSPYRTWVSEVMLQQTQVETVIPYFERFMARFPSVEAIAAAPLDEVLAQWSGLGYYRRARLMHAAAVRVAADGGFPDDVPALRALPGVGDYMAGAIASIAFGRDAVAVDGNVERVVARLFRHPGGRRAVAPLVESLLPKGRAGDFNQALMDLGATVCRARQPRCPHCPLASLCQAAQAGDAEAWPLPRTRRKPPLRQVSCAVVRRDGQVLVARRPRGGLYGGLYELPSTLAQEVTLAEVLRGQLGLVLEGTQVLGEVAHALTHLHLRLAVLDARTTGEPRPSGAPDHYGAVAWVDPAAPGDIGLSTLARKALALAR